VSWPCAVPATGKRVKTPPQANSMTFNERGECTQLTIGYVMDKNIGNTGGLGGVYGIFYALGGARWGDTFLPRVGNHGRGHGQGT